MRGFVSWETSLLRFGRRLGVLAPTRRSRLKLIASCGVMPLKERLPWLYDRWIRLELSKFGKRFSCVVSDLSELRVLAEVFLDEEYDVPPAPGGTSVIVDLGSNIGASILYFSCRYPNARIYGFEPDPRTFAKLKENTKRLPNVTVFEAAVGGIDGTVELFPGEDGSWESSLRGNGSSGALPVRCRRLSAVVDELGIAPIDLLKVDIEGAEYEALECFPELADVAAVVGELHPGRMAGAAPADFVELFDGFHVLLADKGDLIHFVAQNQSR